MELIKPYLRFASTAPYAWAIYLALTLFLQTLGEMINGGSYDIVAEGNFLGSLLMILSGIPFIWFVVQVIVNSRRLLKTGPKFNIKKVIYIILLVFIIAAINQIFKSVTFNLSGNTAQSGVEEVQQESLNELILRGSVLVELPHNGFRVYCDETMANQIYNLSISVKNLHDLITQQLQQIKSNSDKCFDKCFYKNLPGCGDLCYKIAKDQQKAVDDGAGKDFDQKKSALQDNLNKYCTQ